MPLCVALAIGSFLHKPAVIHCVLTGRLTFGRLHDEANSGRDGGKRRIQASVRDDPRHP
ncbi:hypothetical protein [Microvirga thermotolerans]|uniref:hypothetical protein n=1 Tax=Microvirga thermotolerans TaxID=2651334 RepID=UPI0018845ADF|nr:hypothetical protein [Microvirga thermotolerans]